MQEIKIDDKLLNTSIFGIPDEEDSKKRLEEYQRIIGHELKKISKSNVFGYNLKEVYTIKIVIDKECDDNKGILPEYRLYVYGTKDNNVPYLVNNAMNKFVNEGHYLFYYYTQNFEHQLTSAIADYLNENDNQKEYWCRLSSCGMTGIGYTTYQFIVLCFDKKGLETDTLFHGERHPVLENLRIEWSYGKVNDIDKNIDNSLISYNELFRRAAFGSDYFIYLYGDIFNVLSTLKYEGASNVGSILALDGTVEKYFDKLQHNNPQKKLSELLVNYDVFMSFEEPIKIEESSYKKIRKLLEIAKDDLSLLMNEDGEIYAIGKMKEKVNCQYYQVRFEGFFKWSLYKNDELFLRFENMIFRIPDKEVGISNKNIELLKRTLNINDTSKYEKIFKNIVTQKHGTMIVFAENAEEEAKRLKESGICIKPTEIDNGTLIEGISSIDGALICNEKGTCYSIGTILDGIIQPERADSSRGARYNSAIRYIEKQKQEGKKTFIVVVSEDGYINCFSTEE